ncbi:hypothetical protein PVL29_019837 [Vitis rotundifolia]|uniref:Uncharacterized protein n=1 Tax=Vitis rotundifolia TaxID=103349 RepID=A0AA39DE24_VITRO|nr:hypothetical protein PVL29_019837 [Vitis rotundifolia]
MAILRVNRVTRLAPPLLGRVWDGYVKRELGAERVWVCNLLSCGSITRRCISERRHLSDYNATSALEFSETIVVSGCGRDEMIRLSLGSLTLTALAAHMRKRAYSLVGGVAH